MSRSPSAIGQRMRSIEALRAAGQKLGSYRLTDTVLYVTLEPCTIEWE